VDGSSDTTPEGRTITKLVVTVVVALVGLLGFAATRPDSIRLQRALRVNAPPDKVFALIVDFHRWGAWSPWEKLDPAWRSSKPPRPRASGSG
jgi:hypothetical protein